MKCELPRLLFMRATSVVEELTLSCETDIMSQYVRPFRMKPGFLSIKDETIPGKRAIKLVICILYHILEFIWPFYCFASECHSHKNLFVSFGASLHKPLDQSALRLCYYKYVYTVSKDFPNCCMSSPRTTAFPCSMYLQSYCKIQNGTQWISQMNNPTVNVIFNP